MMRELYFVEHSCYLLKGEEALFLFDWYRPSERLDNLLSACPELPLWVLCTHSHHDHFSPLVLTHFSRHAGGVNFLFHDELRSAVPPERVSDVNFLKTGETFSRPGMFVKAYGSTDLGGSLFLELEDGDFKIFHAGDLNNWHWNEEASPEYVAQYEEHWQRELQRIMADEMSLDLLMFPTDLRLGADYLKGLNEFLEEVPTKILAPMHLNGDLDPRKLEQICAVKGIELLLPIPFKAHVLTK